MQGSQATDHAVSQATGAGHQKIPFMVMPPIGPVSPFRPPPQLRIRIGKHQTLVIDQANEDPDREGPPAEPKTVNPVARFLITAQEGVQIEDITLQPPPEGTAQERQRHEC